MKKCSECQATLDESAFGRNRATSDGLSCYCRKCQRAKLRQWRAENPERTRKAARDSKRRQREHEGNEVTRAKWREWYRKQSAHRCAYQRGQNDNAKYRAQHALHRAVKSGRVIRPAYCSACGRECKPDGHHEDYGRPLDVRWLCRKCHRLTQ